MNKKMILMLVGLLGISSVAYSSNNDSAPTFLSKIGSALSTIANYSLNAPTLLLQKISPSRFEGMKFWRAATFDVVVWGLVALAIKVAHDKYQQRKKRSQDKKALDLILAKLERGEEIKEDDEEVKEEAETAPLN